MTDLATFADYLDGIGFTAEPYLERAREVLRVFDLLADEEIEDLLIEEAVDAEGIRTYQHMIGFTESFLLGANNFLTASDTGLTAYRNMTFAIDYRSLDYNYLEATEASRLSVFVRSVYDQGSNWSFHVTGKNCDHLRDLVARRFRGNLVSRQ